jgi:alpha-D-xyloside xylohydrolase
LDRITAAWLTAPPVTADPGRRIDLVTSVRPAGGRLEVRTASGAQYWARISRTVSGALRLRMAPVKEQLGDAPSPMLDEGLASGDVELVLSGSFKAGATGAPPPASATVVDAEEAAAPEPDAEWQGCRSVGLEPELIWEPGRGGFRWGALVQSPALATLTGSGAHIGAVLGTDGALEGWVFCADLGPDDAVYGGGESFQGPDLRGRLRRCVNLEAHGTSGLDASYLTVPFFWSDGGWGLFAHSGAPVRADLGSSHVAVVAVDVSGTVLDLFLYQGSPAEILAQHHSVTGRPGEFPDWAYGVWTSRCTYLDAKEITGIIEGYEQAACPLDVVHIDAWQPGDVLADLSTAWEVDRNNWPEGWSRALHEKGIRLSLWHNPYLRAGTPAGDEAVGAGFVLTDGQGGLVSTNDMPDRLLVDFTNPAACEWWRKQVTDLLAGDEADSIKADFAEEVPPNAVCSDGRTGWEIRNEYALRYQQESNRALRDVTGDDRTAMFCRSGTAGAQRYPCHWVGDTPSTWIGLATAVRACLSLSLSGFAVVGSDVGGFWVAETTHIPNRAVREHRPELYSADVEPELFARWTQWGALSPVMRFHGAGRREPWAYPSPFGDVAVEACRLRRRLRAYLAGIGGEARRSGTPMMRPMALAYPGDRAARSAGLQYLLGPDVLVAPVLHAGGRLEVWAPPGRWEGLAGAPDIEGPGWHQLELALEQVPAWVRAGRVDKVLSGA